MLKYSNLRLISALKHIACGSPNLKMITFFPNTLLLDALIHEYMPIKILNHYIIII